jgi:spore maturation protein CgeB
MRILLVHPGASWSTADVHNGLRFGLSAVGVQTANYQLDVRISRSAQWLYWNWRKSGKPAEAKPNPRDAQYHAGIGVLERALRIDPDWVLIVSGMYLDIEIVQFLKRCGLKVAVLLTESPYDDLAQAEYIRHADVAWTNERTSVARLSAASPRTQVRYLGHAWHPLVHQPLPPREDVPKHDVLFIGTGFPERNQLLADVRWPTDNVALYGHWDSLGSRNKLRRYLRGGVLDNEQAAWYYRAAEVNLNLMRRRQGWGSKDTADEVVAESVNPRCMELAALGRFYVSDSRPELTDLFGDLVPTFETADELSELLARWLAPSMEARRVGVGRELHALVRGHSWADRARQVADDLTAWRPAPVEIELDGRQIAEAAAKHVSERVLPRLRLAERADDEGTAPV